MHQNEIKTRHTIITRVKEREIWLKDLLYYLQFLLF